MSDQQWNPESPLDPIKGEKPHHSAALHDYALMGSRRSVRKLAERYEDEKKKRQRGDTSVPPVPTTSKGTLSLWSRKFDWVNRVLQHDMLQRAEEAKVWEERRKEVREVDWSHASQLRTLAQRIIDAAPAFIHRTKKVVDDGTPEIRDLEGNVIREGRPRQEVITVALSVADLVRVEKLASKLHRMSAEMDGSRAHLTVSWREEAERAGISPSMAYEKLVALLVADQRRGSLPAPGGSSEGGSETDGDE